MEKQIDELIDLITMCDDTDKRHSFYHYILDRLEMSGIGERKRIRRIRSYFEGSNIHEETWSEFNRQMDKPERRDRF